MPINVGRYWYDDAPKRWDAYLKASTTLPDLAKKALEKIAVSRDEINREIEKLTVDRRLAVEKRDDDAKAAAGHGKRCSELKNDIDSWKQELPKERSKLEGLNKSAAEGARRRDQAIEVARRQEKEMSELMGRDDMETPWSDKPVPELEPKVREWAENFVRLKKEKTIAYFKAESEKFGALIDLSKVRKDIAESESRILSLENSIPQAEKLLEELTQAKERAEKSQKENHEAVRLVQDKIDRQNGLLADHDYVDHLQALVGQLKEAALAGVRGVVNEAQENLTNILGAVRAVQHPSYFSKAQEKFRVFENLWKDRTQGLKSLRLGSDVAKNIEAVRAEANLVLTYATTVDSYFATGLPVEAEKVRLATLRSSLKPEIAEEVATRRNSETGLKIGARQLSIDDGILVRISNRCDKGSPFVPETLLGPLLDAMEDAYTYKQEETLKEQAKNAKNKEEETRLKALDDIGNEKDFDKLKPGRKKATIGIYKAQPKESFTHEDVRNALKEDLKLQLTPNKSRWRSILGLPPKAFYDAEPFTDSSGETYKVHTSFFESALGGNADGGVGVYKTDDTKHSADEVMELLFEDGINEVLRAHASVELECSDGRKPHVYVGGLDLYFGDTFDEKVKTKTGHDAGWTTKARTHCQEVLNRKMNAIRSLVVTWLAKDGAV